MESLEAFVRSSGEQSRTLPYVKPLVTHVDIVSPLTPTSSLNQRKVSFTIEKRQEKVDWNDGETEEKLQNDKNRRNSLATASISESAVKQSAAMFAKSLSKKKRNRSFSSADVFLKTAVLNSALDSVRRNSAQNGFLPLLNSPLPIPEKQQKNNHHLVSVSEKISEDGLLQRQPRRKIKKSDENGDDDCLSFCNSSSTKRVRQENHKKQRRNSQQHQEKIEEEENQQNVLENENRTKDGQEIIVRQLLNPLKLEEVEYQNGFCADVEQTTRAKNVLFSSGSHERVFFVYDHQKKAEEDDPKDAILYFYPPSMDMNDQIALVGGIIGTLDFCTEVLGNSPCLVALTTCKFALLKAGPFVLGLSSDLHTPEQHVKDHLKFIWRTFCLFQGSLLAVRQRTGDGFGLELHRTWDCYFSRCQGICDRLSQAFGVLPYRQLSQHHSGVFLEASHILQRAQHQAGVVGGLLLNKNKILCTQLSGDLTRHLLVLMPQNKKFPCMEIKPAFDLPTGVRLLYAFLTAEEIASLGPRKQADGRRKKQLQQDTFTKNTDKKLHPAPPITKPTVPVPESSGISGLHFQASKRTSSLTAVVEAAEIVESEDGIGEVFVDANQPGQFSEVEELIVKVEVHRSKEEEEEEVEEPRKESHSSRYDDANELPVDRNESEKKSSDVTGEKNLRQTSEGTSSGENERSLREGVHSDQRASEQVSVTASKARTRGNKDNGDDSRDSDDSNSAEDGGANSRRIKTSLEHSDREVSSKISHRNGKNLEEDGRDQSVDHCDESSSVDNIKMTSGEVLEGGVCSEQAVEKGVCFDKSSDKFPESSGVSESGEAASNRNTDTNIANLPANRSSERENASVTDGGEVTSQITSEQDSDDAKTKRTSDESDGNSHCIPSDLVVSDDQSVVGVKNNVKDKIVSGKSESSLGNQNEQIADELKKDSEHFDSLLSSSSGVSSADVSVTVTGADNNAYTSTTSASAAEITTSTSGKDAAHRTSSPPSSLALEKSQDPTSPPVDSFRTGRNSIGSPATQVVQFDSQPTVIGQKESVAVIEERELAAAKTERVLAEGKGEEREETAEQREESGTIAQKRKDGEKTGARKKQGGKSTDEKLDRTRGDRSSEQGRSKEDYSTNENEPTSQSVPPDVELNLDFVRSGTSSVLTVSDDLMSPNKERLSFEPALLRSESSGSGGQGGTQEQSSATVVSSPSEPPSSFLRMYSTEPSSSDMAHSANETLSPHSSSSFTHHPSGPRPEHDLDMRGKRKVVLYVQGHMDTLLVLLMDSIAHATRETVNVLWKSSLAKLAELDFAVSDACVVDPDDNDSGKSYMYLKFSTASRVMEGTAKNHAVTSLANELTSSSVLMHNAFARMPNSTDILCRTHTTCCYGHKTMGSETYFQTAPVLKSSGMVDPRDPAFTLDQIADRKLYNDHGNALM